MKKVFILLFTIFNILIVSAQTTSTVFFDSNKSDLKPTSIKMLDSLVSFLKDKNNYKIDIHAYCDNTGTTTSNQILSDQRAQSIFDYFKIKNLNGTTTFKGHSDSNPIADNSTESGKSKNRRAEIILTVTEPPPVVVKKIIEPEPPIIVPTPQTESPTLLDDVSKAEDLEIGKILVLKNLNFVGGTSTLLKESEPSLKLLLKLLKENPTMEIEIEGHVCCANDMALSVDRALTVMEYLVMNGINEKRLKYAGHSWNNPVASDATEEGRKQNRRVEIMILKK